MYALNAQVSALVLPGWPSRLDGYVHTSIGGLSAEMIKFSLPVMENSGILLILPENEIDDNNTFNLRNFLERQPINISIFDNESRCIAKSVVNSLESNNIHISSNDDTQPNLYGGLSMVKVNVVESFNLTLILDSFNHVQNGSLKLKVESLYIEKKELANNNDDKLENENAKRDENKFSILKCKTPRKIRFSSQKTASPAAVDEVDDLTESVENMLEASRQAKVLMETKNNEKLQKDAHDLAILNKNKRKAAMKKKKQSPFTFPLMSNEGRADTKVNIARFSKVNVVQPIGHHLKEIIPLSSDVIKENRSTTAIRSRQKIPLPPSSIPVTPKNLHYIDKRNKEIS